MTVRKFGQGRWLTRTALPLAAATIWVGAAGLATAQPSETPAPTPTPAPSSIFRLPPADDGRDPGVQGPSDNGLPPVAPGERRGSQPTPAPTPAPSPTQPAAPRVIPTQPTTPAPAPDAAPIRRDAPAAVTPQGAPASAGAPEAGGAVLPPLTTDVPVVAAPPVISSDASDPAPASAAPASASAGTPLWAWLLAVFAALGVGVWYWRRRTAVAGAAPEPEIDAPRSRPPVPAPRPASPPAKPAAPPAPRAAAPVPPAVRDEPRPAAPLVTRAAGEQRALVAMTLEIGSIRFAPDHVAVGFALHLTNQGSLPATGLMVRIALNQGSAMPEAVLGRFFDGAGGSVLRDDMMLAVGAGEELTTEVMLPRAAIEPLMIGGKPMLVPVIAFDVTYHWDGEGEAFGQNAVSFVLGREQGTSGSAKLAPLALDRATYLVDRPGARATAVTRRQ
ncbi:hypothetical protein [Sphingopyxis sp.]|uniref:hypothetical protein n=1 Tax=Sphingopyxis sp. TaxID=1908224 RepID=UPI003F6F047A